MPVLYYDFGFCVNPVERHHGQDRFGDPDTLSRTIQVPVRVLDFDGHVPIIFDFAVDYGFTVATTKMLDDGVSSLVAIGPALCVRTLDEVLVLGTQGMSVVALLPPHHQSPCKTKYKLP
jgi:hypothetical protein